MQFLASGGGARTMPPQTLAVNAHIVRGTPSA